MKKLLGVALVIATQLACFEVESTIRLDAKGRGMYSARTAMTPGMSKAFKALAQLDPEQFDLAELKEAMELTADRSTKKSLKARGLKLLKADSDQEALSQELKVRFDRPQALSMLAEIQADGEVNVDVSQRGDGLYVMRLRSRPGLDLDSIDFDPSASLDDEMTGAQAVAMLGALTDAMADMARFRIELSMEVPGEIIDATPELGLSITPGKATWLYNAGTFAAFTGEDMGALDGLKSDGFEVVFAADRPLPTDILTP